MDRADRRGAAADRRAQSRSAGARGTGRLRAAARTAAPPRRGCRLIVAVAVASATVPEWQAQAIRALRERSELDVRVVACSGATPWAPPRGLAARLSGRALQPAAIALDGRDPGGAGVLIDLTTGAAPLPHAERIWRFRFGDGSPSVIPLAREVASGASTFAIALLQDTGGRRERVRIGRFGVTRWHPSTLRRALGEAAHWPAELAGALAAGVALEPVPDEIPPRPPRRAFGSVRFAAMLARRAAASIAETAFEITEWNVGFAAGEPRDVLAGTPLAVRWLPAPRARSFLADPFLVERDGVRVLFAEDFDYDRNRGVIDALVLGDDDRVVERVRALDVPTHLSYPFPLEVDGALYLVPENYQSGEVALYRCVEFPARWERERALLPFDAVDTTPFRYDGRWWAFYTRFSRGSTLALFAAYADDVRGAWTEHPLNPLVIDVGRARPAGAPFVVDGVLYRPAQDCSESYGGGLVLMRVDRLAPDAYRESFVRRIDTAGFGRYADGVHTLGFAAGRVVVDGKRVYRDPRKLGWVAGRVRSRLRRRV